jgi:hypothetical protein
MEARVYLAARWSSGELERDLPHHHSHLPSNIKYAHTACTKTQSTQHSHELIVFQTSIVVSVVPFYTTSISVVDPSAECPLLMAGGFSCSLKA